MTKKSEYISLEESIAVIMQRTGWTRQKTRLFLIEQMRQGKLAGHTIRPEDNKIVQIPKEIWPKVN